MNITKYASKTCVKCKVLDNILKQAGVTDYNVLFSEDNKELFEEKNITTMPTLIFENNNKTDVLEGIVSPNMIKEAIEKVNG